MKSERVIRDDHPFYAGKYTAENECIKLYGVFERFDRHADSKYKFGNCHFWSERYYVRTVGLNEATIRKYIRD